jgi:trimethylamine--corrinoid protein Co-methyltransferase
MLAIHDEIFGMAMRIARGIEVNDDTLATSLIKKIAPVRAHFTAEKHTLEHISSERYLPKLSDKRTYGQWKSSGSKDLAQVARERVKEILATHQPDPLPKDIENELDTKKTEIEKRLSKAT